MLGIDEVVFQQPRCVLTNVESRTLLDILSSRTYAVVVEYLRGLPHPGSLGHHGHVASLSANNLFRAMQRMGRAINPRNTGRCLWCISLLKFH